MTPEIRTITRKLEVRAAEGKSVMIEGYAGVFFDENNPDQTQYELWDGYFERIMPGAFDNVLKRPDDVRCLFNHSPLFIYGRTVAKTLRLSVDSVGLYYSCDLPDSEQARSLAESIRRGDVSGCSLSFRTDGQVWREEKDITYRELTDLTVFDVGPVTFPAYTGTDVSVARSLFDARPRRSSGLNDRRRNHRVQQSLARKR